MYDIFKEIIREIVFIICIVLYYMYNVLESVGYEVWVNNRNF